MTRFAHGPERLVGAVGGWAWNGARLAPLADRAGALLP